MTKTEKIIAQFEATGTLFALPQINTMFNEYLNVARKTKITDGMSDEAKQEAMSARVRVVGMSMKIISACMKEAPEAMRTLAMCDTGKSAEELDEMSDNELMAVYMRVFGGDMVSFFTANRQSEDLPSHD